MQPRQIGETSNPVEPNFTQRIPEPPDSVVPADRTPVVAGLAGWAAMSDTYALSGTGIWSAMLRFGGRSEVADLAGEMVGLGYSALWIPDTGGDVWTPLTNLLAAARSVTIDTGIL